VVCWGSESGFPVPSSVNGEAGSASSIAAGARHSCALQKGTGAVICWGTDRKGSTMPPASVDGTQGSAIAIAAGADYSCAIQAGTRAVVCWGEGEFGEAMPPPAVDGTLGTATAIAAGWDHTLAIAAPEPAAPLLAAASLGALLALARRTR
jgi:alpha-tubulin suppressor-like RCC1 family protein